MLVVRQPGKVAIALIALSEPLIWLLIWLALGFGWAVLLWVGDLLVQDLLLLGWPMKRLANWLDWRLDRLDWHGWQEF